MGYRQDGYTMGARFYATDPAAGSWIEGDVIERALLRPLADSGLLERCRFLSVDFEDPVEIASVDELFERSRSWRDHNINLTSDPTDDADVDILMNVENSETHPGVRIGGAARRELEPRWLALAHDLVLAWARALPASLRLGSGGLSLLDASYPRPVPPRQSPGWQLGLIVQYVGIAFHSSPTYAGVLERLRTDPLPAGATRAIDGDVLTLTFADDLARPERVAAGRAAHEQWLSGIVETEPERGWNEQGDRIVIPEEPESAPPLTLYDAGPRIGYKALVVQPDGSVDEEVWAEARAIAQARALPDGRPVTAVRLIVPRREDAIAVRDRAVADGFEMVTYPRGQGVFWQVG